MNVYTISSPFVMGPFYFHAENAEVEMVRLLKDSTVARDIHFPMCDVRDVAEAYIVALNDNTAEGELNVAELNATKEQLSKGSQSNTWQLSFNVVPLVVTWSKYGNL